MSNNLHYKVECLNLIEHGIQTTDEPIDGKEVFKTFREAKKELLRWLENYKQQAMSEIKYTKSLRKSDI